MMGSAICILISLAGCYTPLNNSGVATTKPWLEISGKKTDFNGKQYDSCYQFKVHFWPQEAARQIDLNESCISACCWRSDKEEVTLDFNKNFESDLAIYGRARKYTPEQITFKVNHANLVNTTRVTVSPHGAVKQNGLIKLSYKEYENPTRLAQVEQQRRLQLVKQNADKLDQEQRAETEQKNIRITSRKTTSVAVKQSAQPVSQPAATAAEPHPAKLLTQRIAGPKIDNYFYQVNKKYNKQDGVFLLSERLFHTQPVDQNTHIVSCYAKARTGADSDHLNAHTFTCGQWLVDLQTQTVTPYDKRAQLIWKE